MDYYDSMKLFLRHASALAAAALLGSTWVHAAATTQQTAKVSPSQPSPSDTQKLAELFYEVLLGEFKASEGDPSTAYALLLDAARKNTDGALYKRATDIALKSRSGDAALAAARAWRQDLPQDRDANRYELQILLALGKIEETAEPLRRELDGAEGVVPRNATLNALPAMYGRAPDKKVAADVVERVLSRELADPDTVVSALTTVGRLQLAAGNLELALDAARKGQEKDPKAEDPAVLALEILSQGAPLAESLVRKYLENDPQPEYRMAYAKVLAQAQQYPQALQQLQILTSSLPQLGAAWLLQGTLQMQAGALKEAETSLSTFISLELPRQPGEAQSRSTVQALMQLSRLAEKRQDYAEAQSWLDKVDSPQDTTEQTLRRASLLAAQGQLSQARMLLRELPSDSPEDKRAALMAEVQLLRDAKLLQDAYELLGTAVAQSPQDGDLLYEQAMLADKLGKTSDMERLLKKLIASHPDYHHAYNALGYSYADRGIQLEEARRLIRKALEFAPDDPYINDSLAWTEFRSGNFAEALRILEIAFKAKPDAEIAAHMGEVLWAMGDKKRALDTWREGLKIDSDNATLRDTLKRLHAKP
jgi:tetratricopeptide (TPR) repeat protein